MLTTYNLKMPHAVYGGENAMDNITAILKARGSKHVAIFTDKGIEAAGLFTLPEEAVKASGADYYVLDDLPAEPSYMAVQKLVDQFQRKRRRYDYCLRRRKCYGRCKACQRTCDR